MRTWPSVRGTNGSTRRVSVLNSRNRSSPANKGTSAERPLTGALFLSEHALHDADRLEDRARVVRGKAPDATLDLSDAQVAALRQYALALWRHLEAHNARVVNIAAPMNEPDAFHFAHHLAHRRRLHLLGRGHLAERARPTHEHRERGQLRRGNTGERVGPPHAAQEMDGRRVQPVGGLAFPASRGP